MKKKAKTYNFPRGGQETDTFTRRKAGAHKSRNLRRCRTRSAQKRQAIKEF